MNLKNKIRNSWKNPDLPDTFSKKDELDFSKRKRISISLRIYALSICSLILVFSMSIFLIKFKNDRNNDVPPINKIEFGTLDPFDLNISVKNLNKVHINNKSYYNVRGNFTLWFNNLDIEKSKVDYSTIDLKSYINGVKPVNICIENEEYNLFFTKEDYLIVFYNNIYIMYDLKQADILLESFISSF